MIEVKIIDWMPSQGIEVSNKLIKKGYVRGIDYDWEYHKPKYDDTTYESVYNRYCIFRFYKDELATWFSLTYM